MVSGPVAQSDFALVEAVKRLGSGPINRVEAATSA